MDTAKNKDLPFEIQDVEADKANLLMKYYTGERTGFVRVGPKGYFMPQKYRQEAANIYNMPLRDTDIFVASYPRSGTTWTQELVWLIANDLDYEKAAASLLVQRFPFLEYSTLCHPYFDKFLIEHNKNNKDNLALLKFLISPGAELIGGLPSPRFIKTHLPFSLLPPTLLDTTRVVYVARDPRDVVVSFFFLYKQITTMGFSGEFKEFWNFFLNYETYWCPYFEHIKEAWKKREHPHMLFLFYEDLIKDLTSAARLVGKFLGKELSEHQVDQLCEHLSFAKFKTNQSVNGAVDDDLGFNAMTDMNFVRKGKTGGWRDYFDEEMTQQGEKWILDNLRGTDLRFPAVENLEN